MMLKQQLLKKDGFVKTTFVKDNDVKTTMIKRK